MPNPRKIDAREGESRAQFSAKWRGARAVSVALALTLFSAASLFAQAAPAASPANLSVDEIIARNLAARGGREKFQSIHSIRLTRHVTYTSSTGERSEYDDVVEMERPNLFRFEQRFGDRTYEVETYDGKAGWKAVAGEPKPSPLEGSALADVTRPVTDRIEGEFVDYAAKGYRVEYRGLQKSQGRDCYGVITTMAGGRQEYRCIDAGSFLDTEIRDETTTMLRSDFRNVEGMLFPFRMDTSSQKGSGTIAVTNIEINPKLEEADFRKPRALKAVEAAATIAPGSGPSAEQVRWARQVVADAILHVRTCQALPFMPACSFGSAPSNIQFTQKKITFQAPVNQEWGGPRTAYINLADIPKLNPKVREGWRILSPEQIYVSFDPGERKYDKAATNILFDRPRLEWVNGTPYAAKFLEALDILKLNAQAPVDAEEKELGRFREEARKWRELPEKPALPDAVHREEVLAKDAISTQQNPQLALQHFEKGLEVDPLWPAGQLAAATICGELKNYDCAVEHAERYLELLPEGPQAGVLRDKVIIWKDRMGSE